MDYNETTPLGLIVPQQAYHTKPAFNRLPSIQFCENGQWGVSLQNAVDKNLQGLHDKNKTPQLAHTAQKVTLRINVGLKRHDPVTRLTPTLSQSVAGL